MDSANAASVASQKRGSSLTQRLLSALVLIPLILVPVWWNYWAVVALVIAAMVVGLLELFSVFTQGGYRPRVWFGLSNALALCLSVALNQHMVLSFDPLPIVLTAVIIVSLVAELPRHNHHEHVLPSWALTLGGALYIGWLLSHFIMLRALETPLRPSLFASLHIAPGTAWVYFVLSITWLQDSVAYFVGKSFGRHKMAPILSPKKTWEGMVGGLFGSVAGSILSLFLLGLPISFMAAVLAGLVGGIVGPLGDLAESLIKREIGVKDAGYLIPGHGGLLDRADSLLFTGPVLFYLIRLLTA